MTLTTYDKFYIAHDALAILVFVPSVILFFCALCMARRRQDPARTGFTWLKVALLAFLAFVFFDICGYALSLAYTVTFDNTSISDDEDALKTLFLGQIYFFVVSHLFECFMDILILIMLLRLCSGVIIVRDGKMDTFGKATRWGSYGLALLLVALNFAQFGLKVHFYSKRYDDDYFNYGSDNVTYNLVNDFETSRQVDFVFKVLIFIAAIVVVVRSILVRMNVNTDPRLASASLFFIVASVLFLLKTCYDMASMAAEVNLSNAFNDPAYHNYYYILDVIFGIWPVFVLLVIVFIVGTKKANGLWSTEQFFNVPAPAGAGAGAAQTAWGYSYDPNSAPPQQQQQQQQFQDPQYQQTQYQQQGWQQQQQQQQPYYQQVPVPQGYPPQQQYANYGVTQTQSPPPHEESVGLNHQANGSPPQMVPQPYVEKA